MSWHRVCFRSLPSSLKISQVARGARHTLLALQDGTGAACGNKDYGQIGSSSGENVIIPSFVEVLDHVAQVSCGANHSLALTGLVQEQHNKDNMLLEVCWRERSR
ncbi:protein RCC2-like isoform X2 [Vanacampus margaritifer]